MYVDDELGIGGIGILRLDRQIEPGRSLTDKTGDGVDALIIEQVQLDILQSGGHVLDAGPFRVPDIHHELGHGGKRKKLLLELPEPDDRRPEQHHQHSDGQPAKANGLFQQPQVDPVETAAVGIGPDCLLVRFRQHVDTLHRGDGHGNKPGTDQRDGHDREQGTAIFAGILLGGKDRIEGHDRNDGRPKQGHGRHPG